LRDALNRRSGSAEKHPLLLDDDAETLKEELELIRVVSVDDGQAEPLPVDKKSKLRDDVTAFCRRLHAALAQRLPGKLSPPEKDAVAEKPYGEGGNRQYMVPLQEENLFGENIFFTWDIYWHKKDKELYSRVRIEPTKKGTVRTTRGKIADSIRNNTIYADEYLDFYRVDLDTDFPQEKFTEQHPEKYVEQLLGFYKWFSALAKKLN
jgi:hypothetical protein